MSFSSEVKAELEKQIGKSRHCQLAELSAIVGHLGRLTMNRDNYSITIVTEHVGLAKKCFTLFRRAFDLSPELESGNACSLKIRGKDEVRRVLMALKFLNEDEQQCPPKLSDRVNGLLVQNSCCRRAFLRGVFLSSGSISDPNKSYHFEIVCDTAGQAQQIQEMMIDFDTDAKIVERKNHYVVYLKEGAQIVDMLNVMEAHVALMNLENVRILKEMRNHVNRTVNCETANINKAVNAAVKQIADIRLIRERGGLESLPKSLRQVAEVRLEHPDATLKELGEYLCPPVGKSGVNHRLRKIGEIADHIRDRGGHQ
ncbi:MAG: DNA-binding protein WhiA [Lachnospiraceae bacterium]|nr:DNA-binding protein WhiA [Lachnospiraceae bacterium]